MEQAKAKYYHHAYGPGKNRVTFLVNSTGKRLVRDFESPYLARLFVNKLRHSRKCTLIGYPYFP